MCILVRYVGYPCTVRAVVNGVVKSTGKVSGIYSGIQLEIPFQESKSNKDICIRMKSGRTKVYSNIHSLQEVNYLKWKFISDIGEHEIDFN